MTHGNQMTIDNTAIGAVRPTPRVLAGGLTPSDQRTVADWIRLNEEAIIAYWNEQLDTGEFIERLKVLRRS